MAKPKMTEAAEALSVALNDLQGLQFAYDEAKSAERAASMASTDAVNRLNAKQKEVDRLFADVRGAGSGGWSSERRKTDAVLEEPNDA